MAPAATYDQAEAELQRIRWLWDSGTRRPPTDPQLRYATDLAAAVGVPLPEIRTMADASRAIERLKPAAYLVNKATERGLPVEPVREVAAQLGSHEDAAWMDVYFYLWIQDRRATVDGLCRSARMAREPELRQGDTSAVPPEWVAFLSANEAGFFTSGMKKPERELVSQIEAAGLVRFFDTDYPERIHCWCVVPGWRWLLEQQFPPAAQGRPA